MRKALWAVAIVAGIISGCVPSIHGIATKETMVWDDQLMGIWGEPNDPNRTEMWRFDKGQAEKSYSLIYVDDRAKVGKFDAALVTLGEMRFLDIYPKELSDDINGYYKGHWVPAHTFARVEEIGDKLRIRMMDPDKLKKMLDKEPGLIKHETVDDAVLLTAGTVELQVFLRKHVDDIWSDEMVMVRKNVKK
jgi:hypothetical protein